MVIEIELGERDGGDTLTIFVALASELLPQLFHQGASLVGAARFAEDISGLEAQTTN